MPQIARKRRRDSPEISVGSFSDIAFLLIIFFILATTFVKTHGFLAELPSSKKSPQSKQEKSPTVVLSGEQILFNGDQVDLGKLRDELRELELAKESDPAKRFVMLETQGNVRYEEYYNVWAMITKAGGNVAIVEREE